MNKGPVWNLYGTWDQTKTCEGLKIGGRSRAESGEKVSDFGEKGGAEDSGKGGAEDSGKMAPKSAKGGE